MQVNAGLTKRNKIQNPSDLESAHVRITIFIMIIAGLD